jgi:undecaprenyl-diphosphatase
VDAAIVLWFAAHRSAPLDLLASVLTVAGRLGLVFIVAAAIRGLSKRTLAMAAWQTALAALVAGAVADAVVKPLVDRPRPYTSITTLQVVGQPPVSTSFPSGHAAACVAGALLLASTWPRARAGVWAVAGLVAVARVYMGVHYPTDALGGAVVGWAVGWFVRGRTLWRWNGAAEAPGSAA